MSKYTKISLVVVFIAILFTSCSKEYLIDYFEDDNMEKTIEKKLILKKTPKIEENQPKKKESLTEEKKEVVQVNDVQQQSTHQAIVKAKPIVKEPIKLVSYPKQIIKRTSVVASRKTINQFDFDIIKKGFKDDNTLLIVGGIQGDEPGGFMAASLLATHYKITKGSVWVVPNLNFYSIIKRSRGPYGDMNRKFAYLSKDDPEYETIQRIKGYITAPEVKLILNLHDGSGFYRPKYIDKMHQPHKWGQCSVIDQEVLPGVKKYANTFEISEQVVNHINNHLLKEEDRYRTKNTHTKFKATYEEKEMAKTLTYYAVSNGKSAFGHETSKSLTVSQRVYYKLLALEKYMQIMGIEYERKFNLNDQVIKNILDNDIEISLYDGKIKLPLSQIRNILKYFPVKQDGTIDFIPSNPLMSIVKEKNEYTIYYGNRRLSKLRPDFMAHTYDKLDIKVKVDGKLKKFKFGDTIKVNKNFKLLQPKNYRVNIIGYTVKGGIETNKLISYKQMIKRFSIDKKGKRYRVEFYTKKKFAGMVLIEFAG